ncbi:uncharacterized protein BDR25DRAFT_287024 [Lindgomyces ingoldianus]|uniref:Uncharacterized protein n=1 Tax=Lindgomyces ingoldianus TaxID=673940 RepID=A0ACB6QVC0_9PLEO|nr:uncharacterized protein BDR25DRAFT_287024 [Lindgomyces ingoldianus]KAF2470807.1 hypothetical protein BDR25DRAFT_287024 [Lindgomyces ingoldianus]
MATTAGLVLAAIALIEPTIKLINGTLDFIQDTNNFGKDAYDLGLKMSQQKSRYDSLQKVLFEDNKFPFINGKPFAHLPEEKQRILLAMLREIPQLLFEYYVTEVSYNLKPSREELSDSRNEEQGLPTILTSKELETIFEKGSESEVFSGVLYPKTGKLQKMWWSVRGKKRAVKLVAQFQDWLKRIRETLEDCWWPLPFFDKSSNLQVVEDDVDAQAVGVAQKAGLRKILLDDSRLPGDVKLSTPQLTVKGFDKACRGFSRYDDKDVFVEYLPYEPDKDGFLPRTLRRRFGEIAWLLNQQKDPEFRALHCFGYIDSSFPRKEFQLVYRVPENRGKSPKSLLSLYGDKKFPRPSLGDRVSLCQLLAQSMSLLHSVGWIHKGFRSSNVLFFPRASETQVVDKLEDPFIVGFEACRLEDDFSTGPYDNLLSQNIYRHPDRWGIPKKPFTKYHDIYALGIVLLEIGLWEKAETMGNNNFQVVKQNSDAICKELLRQAERRLGYHCGGKFKEIVRRCITGDFDITTAADDKLDTQLQSKFRELIIMPLAEMAKAV